MRDAPSNKVARVELGPISSIREGMNSFPLKRVVVTKEGDNLWAMSLVCTHQNCIVRHGFEGFTCPCHGSNFSHDGAVKTGPATKDLPHYRLNLEGELLTVVLGEEVGMDWRLSIKSSQTS